MDLHSLLDQKTTVQTNKTNINPASAGKENKPAVFPTCQPNQFSHSGSMSALVYGTFPLLIMGQEISCYSFTDPSTRIFIYSCHMSLKKPNNHISEGEVLIL